MKETQTLYLFPRKPCGQERARGWTSGSLPCVSSRLSRCSSWCGWFILTCIGWTTCPTRWDEAVTSYWVKRSLVKVTLTDLLVHSHPFTRWTVLLWTMPLNTAPCMNNTISLFATRLQGALHLNDTVVPQPHLLHLSAERLSRDGAFLMDCGNVSF